MLQVTDMPIFILSIKTVELIALAVSGHLLIGLILKLSLLDSFTRNNTNYLKVATIKPAKKKLVIPYKFCVLGWYFS
jgi:hypothetical protein